MNTPPDSPDTGPTGCVDCGRPHTPVSSPTNTRLCLDCWKARFKPSTPPNNTPGVDREKFLALADEMPDVDLSNDAYAKALDPPNNTPTRTPDGKMTDAATVYWWIRNNAPPAADAIAAIQSVVDHAGKESRLMSTRIDGLPGMKLDVWRDVDDCENHPDRYGIWTFDSVRWFCDECAPAASLSRFPRS